MAFREISLMDTWELVRRWHDHHSISQIAQALGYDRKTVRRYIRLAQTKGLTQEIPLPPREEVLRLLGELEDTGAEFTATIIRGWLQRLGVTTLFITPGSPWENGYIESFNGKLRDELLNREIFDSVQEAKVLAARYRWEYNAIRPHSSLGFKPPAPEAYKPLQLASA